MSAIDPVFVALEALRARDYDTCDSQCLSALARHPRDQAAWHTRARCAVARVRLDDAEAEETGIADSLLDENATAAAPRPGTSLKGNANHGVGELGAAKNSEGGRPPATAALRPMSHAGRPMSGFVRPGTRAQLLSRGGGASENIGGSSGNSAHGGISLSGSGGVGRIGTARVMTAAGGRSVRLGTASLSSGGADELIDLSRVDLAKYARRDALARALCDYLIYTVGDYKRALELATLCTSRSEKDGADARNNGNSSGNGPGGGDGGGPSFSSSLSSSAAASSFSSSAVSSSGGGGGADWWWFARKGRCFFRLGLLRDAEREFKRSLDLETVVTTILELVKVYMKLDQPNAALSLVHSYLGTSATADGGAAHSGGGGGGGSGGGGAIGGDHNALGNDVDLLLCVARLQDGVADFASSVASYERVLAVDPSCVEAIASVASHYFYNGQPEHALVLYRRLLQNGCDSCEIWNNVALCCLACNQWDLVVRALENALSRAGGRREHADVWYNASHLANSAGDLQLAYQCLKVAIASDPGHAEAINNLAVLESRGVVSSGAGNQAGGAQAGGNQVSAIAGLRSAREAMPGLYEPWFNAAVLSRAGGDVEETFSNLRASLNAFPGHFESKDLLKKLREMLTVL